MRETMLAWPNIVFIDGTYKLTNCDLTLMIFLVEDGNGSSEVVGAALISSEDYETFHWLLSCFKTENAEACSKIKCWMSDKDLLEREVLKELFPHTVTYICVWHTLKTFSRQITVDKMKITSSERNLSLEFLSKLLYSKTPEHYDEIYSSFCESVPESVVEYFDKNWNPIKTEWTVHNMTVGNAGHITNNKLENVNGKIKQTVKKNSSPALFVHSFMAWLNCHKHDKDHKAADHVLKKFVRDYGEASEYVEFVTKHWHNYIIEQIELSKNITVIEELGGTYRVQSSKGVIAATPTSCECQDWLSKSMPCRHIFAVRQLEKLPLFDRLLCNERFTKEYYLNNQRVMRDQFESIDCDNVNNIEENNNEEKQMPSVIKSTLPKILPYPRKRTNALIITNSLANLAALCSDKRYYERTEVLKELDKYWRMDLDVSLFVNPGKTGEAEKENLKNEAKETELESKTDNETNTKISTTVILKEIENGGAGLCIDSDASSDNVLVSYVVENGILIPEGKINSCPEDDADTFSEDALEKIKWPTAIKRRGRPKNSETTVAIGLKKNRQVKIPKSFRLLKEEEKIGIIFNWILSNKSQLTAILNGDYLVNEEDLEMRPEIINHGILDEEVNLEILKPYMTETGHQTLKKTIETKLKIENWLCKVCEVSSETSLSIVCESCLMWYHINCVGLKSVPKKKSWFCFNCSSY